MRIRYSVVARPRPRVMAEIITMLVHRDVRTEELSFQVWEGECILVDLVAEVSNGQSVGLVAQRLHRIVDVLDVTSCPDPERCPVPGAPTFR